MLTWWHAFCSRPASTVAVFYCFVQFSLILATELLHICEDDITKESTNLFTTQYCYGISVRPFVCPSEAFRYCV